MNRPIFFTPEAGREVSDIEENYRAIRPELGTKFSHALEQLLVLIREFPLMGAKIIKSSRRLKLLRFPYHVYYKPKRDRIVIWAVFHTHRDTDSLNKKELRA
ncbi:MAG: type II toxin-antitoxin system RelE/ParE family toxin [Planctomycetota bacterium]